MSYQRARQQLDAAFTHGEIDADTWEAEREALEYAHEQAQSAQDDDRRVS